MNYLSAEKLSISYGVKVLFTDLTFGISRGQKVALVGRNGCGKSTLLRILAKKAKADSGQVSLRNGISVEFLDQNPDFGQAKTVREAVFQGDDPTLTTIRDYQDLSSGADISPEAMQSIMDRMESLQAWDYESRIQEVLGKLGIHEQQLALNIIDLSGGQRKRVSLAKILVQEPDLLILDEPTNHLDTSSIEWLENHLAGSKVTLVLVTHDRYFLDRVCNEIIELEGGDLYRYPGNYEFFLEKKAERHDKEATDADKANNLLRKELEWLRRQPKARTTKSKAKVSMVHELIDQSHSGHHEDDININFSSRRLGSKILELDHLYKSYDELVLINDFSYVFKKRERIGIVGPNGVGKSTFLDIITDKLAPDKGTVVKGETIYFGYYKQSGLKFRPKDKVIDVIKDAAENIAMGTGEKLGASQVLTLFGFPPGVQYTWVSELSGGEKRRLYLLRILMEQPNFLILDEPTNDLDIITLNTLEQFLLAFGGCLIIVSHDRYFLNKLCDHLFVFEGEGKIRDFHGNYRQYREKKALEDKQLKEEAGKQKIQIPVKSKQSSKVIKREEKKLSYKEQREYEQLETEIEKMEGKKEELTALLSVAGNDYEALGKMSKELEELEKQLENKTDRWLELAERA